MREREKEGEGERERRRVVLLSTLVESTTGTILYSLATRSRTERRLGLVSVSRVYVALLVCLQCTEWKLLTAFGYHPQCAHSKSRRSISVTHGV